MLNSEGQKRVMVEVHAVIYFTLLTSRVCSDNGGSRRSCCNSEGSHTDIVVGEWLQV